MILDSSFKLSRLIVQAGYPPAPLIWDCAGKTNSRIQRIWPGLEFLLDHISPNQVILKSPGVQVETGLEKSTISLFGLKTIDQLTSDRIVETFGVWREFLGLEELSRISSRVIYTKDFKSISTANSALFALAKYQIKAKVFDQPVDSPLNTIDCAYKFEDESSFAFLRIRTEQVTVEITPNADMPNLKGSKETTNRLVIDFDRGIKKKVAAADFRMDEWLKGFVHVFRRDLEKVVGE